MMNKRKSEVLRKNKILWGLVILFAALCLLVLLPGTFKVLKLQNEVGKTKKNIERLQAENESLKKEIQNLQNDPFTIEKIAREKLGLVRPGELKIKFYKSDEDTGTKKHKKKR